MHETTISQLPAAGSADPNAVVAADNAASTVTQKVTLSQIAALALQNTGVTPGSYSYVTVDASGRVTAGADDPKWAYFLPGAPTSVSGAASDQSVAVSWTAPSPAPAIPVSDYGVQYSDNDGSTWTTFADGVGTSTSATVTGLTNGTAYKFRVRAVNSIGAGAYSDPSATVTPSAGPAAALLLHFDGANGSTTFTDSSANNFTVTANGNAVISTAQSKFGGASGYFDGASTLTVPYSSAFDLQSGDWTVEFWYWSANAATAASNLISVNSSISLGGQVQIQAYPAQGHGFRMLTSANGSWVNTNIIGSFTEDQWHHIAAVRSGDNFYFFVNGVQALTYQYSGDLTAISGPLVIGNELSNSFPTTGYIDELRIIKGVAAYTSNFTPPSAPF